MRDFITENGVLVKCNGDIKVAMLSADIIEIGANAFADCASLNQIKLSVELTTINEKAFLGCSKLTRIIFPDTITTIADGAFSGCSSLDDNALKVINSINPNALT